MIIQVNTIQDNALSNLRIIGNSSKFLEMDIHISIYLHTINLNCIVTLMQMDFKIYIKKREFLLVAIRVN